MSAAEQARALATRNLAERNARTKAREAESALVLVRQFKDNYGFDAVSEGRVKVDRYVRRSEFFNQVSWRLKSETMDTLRVDDILLARDNEKRWWVLRPCEHCYQRRAWALPYVSTIGSDDEKRAKFLAAVGAILINSGLCSHCQAQPCSLCGAVR